MAHVSNFLSPTPRCSVLWLPSCQRSKLEKHSLQCLHSEKSLTGFLLPRKPTALTGNNKENRSCWLSWSLSNSFHIFFIPQMLAEDLLCTRHCLFYSAFHCELIINAFCEWEFRRWSDMKNYLSNIPKQMWKSLIEYTIKISFVVVNHSSLSWYCCSTLIHLSELYTEKLFCVSLCDEQLVCLKHNVNIS